MQSLQKDDGTVLIERNAMLKGTEQFYKKKCTPVGTQNWRISI